MMRPEDVRTGVKAAGAFAIGAWGGLHPLMQALLILMCLDMASGILAGYATKSLDSHVSGRGVAKKVLGLILVAGAHIASRALTFDLPLGSLAAGFYCMHELMSITENAARAGLPLPRPLTDALQKLQKESS